MVSFTPKLFDKLQSKDTGCGIKRKYWNRFTAIIKTVSTYIDNDNHVVIIQLFNDNHVL
jgi:hypothetical protein